MTAPHLDSVPVLTDRSYQLDPDAAMAVVLEPGGAIVCRTLDSSGGQIHEGVQNEDLVPARMFPVSGPIGVAGARPGDAIGVEIRSIEPAGPGHTWTRPGLGFASAAEFNVRRLDAHSPVIDWGSGAPIPVAGKLHIGALGVLPTEPTAPRTLGVYGGNLDFLKCAPGSTVWFPAQVEQGGVFVGDVHAAIGDGEICGTGIEIAADVTIGVHHRPDWTPPLPTVVTPDRIWVIGIGDTFEEALAAGVDHCVRSMAARQGMTTADAYLAVGLLLTIRVCQMVNPRRSVAVSLGSGMDRVLAPGGVVRHV